MLCTKYTDAQVISSHHLDGPRHREVIPTIHAGRNPLNASWPTKPHTRGNPIVSPVRIPPSHAIRNLIITVCVLLLAASAGCTTTPGHPSTRDVQVPDVTGQLSADAIASLQKLGLVVSTQQKPDFSVPPGHVINTDPKANTAVGAGAEITVNVSTGPEQREIPDVSNLTYDDAVHKLSTAGFGTIKESSTPSTPEQKGLVVRTDPPAGSASPITNEITIFVGSGP